MADESYDVIILGQGLAGTALAWRLLDAGTKVLVIDRGEAITSSRVAAGLITPITGLRLVKTWRFDEHWAVARDFYRDVERRTGTEFLRETSMVRLLASEGEREFFERRRLVSEFSALVRRPPLPPLDGVDWDDPFGAFEMFPAAQLNVPRYLNASRDRFLQAGSYRQADVRIAEDIDVRDAGVHLARLGVRADRLVFCQGIDARDNPWFRTVQFRPAKGEILTLRIPGLRETRVVHRGVWLAPIGDDLFRVGSNYEWERLDNSPTGAARDDILARLSEFLTRPVEVVEHRAAVRPIHLNQYPVLGLHPDRPQLGYLNGLGSKGSLQAPWLARRLADLLLVGTPADRDIDLHRRTDLRGCAP